MNRNNGKTNGNHRDKKATDRYRSLRSKGGAVTEDQRLLTRPTQPLISPTEPMPHERVREEEHAFERASSVSGGDADLEEAASAE